MAAKLKDVVKTVEKFAPPDLAESWDRVGLFLGDPNQEVNRILFALGISEAVVQEAIEYQADLILTHHPLWMTPPVYLNESKPEGRVVAELMRNRIAVYSAHTNLDACIGGVNDMIASRLRLSEIAPLSEIQETWFKLAVYVPESHWQKIRFLMGELGVGQLGDYSHCTFSSEGIGSFLPLEGAEPAIGAVGVLEQVRERKIEGIINAREIHSVLRNILKAHPYEEVAYDLIPLKTSLANPYGIGKVGKLEKEMTLGEFADYVKKMLDLDGVRAFGDLGRRIQTVALCGGSGMSFLEKVLKTPADVFLTGDIKHHEAEAALASGLVLIDGGHYGTEKGILSVLAEVVFSEHALESKISETEGELFSFR